MNKKLTLTVVCIFSLATFAMLILLIVIATSSSNNLFAQFGVVPLCNKNPDRAIYFGKFCFPLCFRCTFIISGFVVGLVLFWLVKSYEYKFGFLVVAGILIIPTFLDGTIQQFTAYESTNTMRAVTGFLAGIGFAMGVNYIFAKTLQKKKDE